MAPRSKPTEREPMAGPRMEIPAGRAVAVGRDGQPLFRRQTLTTDQFEIPAECKEPGWSLEWKRYTMFGQPDKAYEAALYNNGWRPVPVGRFPGVFMPMETPPEQPITRGDLILMERPETLTKEAREEERRAANDKMRTAIAQHGLGNKLGRGFEPDRNNTGISDEKMTVNVSGDYDLA